MPYGRKRAHIPGEGKEGVPGRGHQGALGLGQEGLLPSLRPAQELRERQEKGPEGGVEAPLPEASQLPQQMGAQGQEAKRRREGGI